MSEPTSPGELDNLRNHFTANDFTRLERKVDRLGDAMAKFLLIEERQVNQNTRIALIESDSKVLNVRLTTQEKLVAQWINRGIGIWALAVTLWSLFQFFVEKPGGH